MKSTRSQFPTVTAAIMLVACGFMAVGPVAHAQSSRPLTTADFKYSPERGFGDRDNSWAQSMVWWKDHLYVGTGRAAVCTSLFSLWRFADAIFGREFADTFLPYPPNDPDLSCPADGADLRLQAEIWRFTPGGNQWDRVFQSPNDLDNPGPPPVPGKKVPYEMTFRGMAAHTDPDGTEALYAFGVNTAVMYDNTKIPPPRVLRTTDGETWTPVPQTPGTFLGDMPYNADHSSFRSPLSFKGKLFVLSGPIFGQGALIGSENPAAGDDAWFLAAPANVLFYEMSTFNGWLYLGTFSPVTGGYSVIKTRAEGPPPYQFQTVIPVGAFHPDPIRASRSVVSMNEFQGRLYVGTASMTEVVRINPDDTWDLVVGPPRVAPALGGVGVEFKYPLSGLDNGFGHTPNDHAWQMGDLYRQLYIGTYNATVGARNNPIYGPLLSHNMGAHLYRTSEGWYYNAITTDGFANLGDPHGGKYDYGLRTMVTTPHGAFLGTANDYWGLTVFRANTAGTSTPPAPPRLEIEPVRSGAVLLSWQDMGQAKQYQVWRAERLPAFFRTELNIEAWNVISGNLIADTYIAPYQQIALTTTPYYVDGTVEPGHQYMYYVVQVTQNRLSDQSNLVGFPLLMPPMTYTMLQREIDKIALRGRMDGPEGLAKIQAMVDESRAAAAYCDLEKAKQALNPKKASTGALFPESVDVEVMAAKLVRRLQMYQTFPAEVLSTEFCVP